MKNEAAPASSGLCYELRFPSNCLVGPSLSFPCDAAGNVALHRLGERLRHNYLFALSEVGGDFGWPRVHARPA
jgi:hypothetical protein